MRLAGERSALAAAVLAFYGFLFLLVTMNPPPGWATCFGTLAALYGLGFFALVAGYFWARWYAIGLGMSGFISAAFSMWQMGPEPVLLFYGGTHAFIALALWGSAVASRFDGQAAWRARFHLDENGVNRLGKAIIRAGISLPYIVMYALAPKQPGGADLLALLALGLAGTGLWALIKLRTWGVVALAGSAATLFAAISNSADISTTAPAHAGEVVAFGIAGAILVAAAAVPFIVPMARFVRQQRR
jgi:hypothetical protein